MDLKDSKEEDGRVVTQGAELRAAGQTTQLDKNTQLLNQFQIPNVPSAPTLYPSLRTLEESPMVQLCENSVKNTEKGPAVLALPEQESLPPSLQALESVAELSGCKLYPELPKTVPVLEVIKDQRNTISKDLKVKCV